MFGIIKQSNGNVLFIGEGVNLTLTQDYDIKQLFGDTISISKAGSTAYSFKYNQVEYYTIYPSAVKTAPPANIEDFTAILQNEFFFPVSASGGVIDGALILDSEATLTITTSPLSVGVVENIANINKLYLQPTSNCILQGLDITNVSNGQVIQCINKTNFSVLIPEENVNPPAENRFTMAGTQRTIAGGASIAIIRDLNRWRILY
jgi:hypothetical protein